MHRIARPLTVVLGFPLLAGAGVLASSAMAGDVAVPASLSVRGTIVDDRSQPVNAALVSARDVKTDVTTVAITSADGRFILPHQHPGSHEFIVSREGYAPVTLTAALPESKPFRAALRRLPVIPVAQMRDSDIILTMPDDDPARTKLGGGGGVAVPVAAQSEKTLVRDRCVRCHTLGIVFQARHTRAEWDQVVSLMETFPTGSINPAGYTLTGNPAVKPRIIDYLTTYLGPDSQVPDKMERDVRNAYHDDVPLGSGVVYTEWKLPSAIAMGHTAVPDNRGHVFITEWAAGKIASFDLKTGEFTEYPVKKQGGNPHGINVGPDGIVWYTSSSDGDLGRLDPRTGVVEEFTPPKEQPAGLNLIIARNGIVWYAAPGGIGSFDPTTKQFGRVIVEEGMRSPYALIQSRQDADVIWFCVEEQNKVGFVNVRTGKSKLWHTVLPGPKRPRVDSQGRVWFGYYEGGAVGMIDPVTLELTDVPLPYRGSAYAIHVDDQDNVWVASYERGSLIRIDARSRALTEYPWPSPGGIVRDIWPDAEGNLWYVHFAWTHNVLVRAERPHAMAPQGLAAAAAAGTAAAH